MVSSKRPIGTFITPINHKNSDGKYSEVLGIAIEKEFMPSVANIIGTDLTKYNVISKDEFAFNPMHVGRDKKLPIALYRKEKPALISPAYMSFKVKDSEEINNEYLMLLFKNKIFDHLCWFHTDSTVRGGLTWDDFCSLKMKIPGKKEQENIVSNIKTIDNKISINNKINFLIDNKSKYLIDNYSSKTKVKVPLNKIVTFINGYAFKSDDYLHTGTYKIITIKNVKDGLIDTNELDYLNILPSNLSKECCLKIGDILLSLTGNVGRVGIVTENNLLLNQRVAKVKAIDQELIPFVYFFMRQQTFKKELEKISTGTAQQNLSTNEAYKIEIPFEYESAKKLSKGLKKLFSEILYNNTQNQKLDNLKKILLQDIY